MIDYNELKGLLISGYTYNKIAKLKHCSTVHIHQLAVEWELTFIQKSKVIQYRLREERKAHLEEVKKEKKKIKKEEKCFFMSTISNSEMDNIYLGRRYDRE